MTDPGWMEYAPEGCPLCGQPTCGTTTTTSCCFVHHKVEAVGNTDRVCDECGHVERTPFAHVLTCAACAHDI